MPITLGGFFQDIGKFMQRAYGSVNKMQAFPRQFESIILPVYNHQYSHKHVLWTEAFFHWMETEQGLSFPKGINLNQVRNMAIYHHKPEANNALGWLAAEADRLSSGMDRKPSDEAQESKSWNQFIKTPIRCLF